MKKFLSNFNNLSIIKKMALIMFVLFSLFLYWATNAFYYYLIHTIGIPQLSIILGFTMGTLDWILYKLPFYFKVVSIIIFLPIVIIIIIMKKKKKKQLA